jgi:hypothetical protein
MKKRIKRKYTMTDSVMLTRLRVAFLNLKEDHPLFLEKFPWLDDAYLLTIQNDIKAAGEYKSDVTVVLENKVKGYKQPAMKESAKNLRKLFKYVAIAYSSSRKMLRMFGQSDMAMARNNISKMVTLLKYAHAIANKIPYKNDLLNRGYKQEEIDNLQTLATQLGNQQGEHTSAQTTRPVSTVDRIILLNVAFDHLWTISICARVVFMKNPAKIKQYKIYP